MVPRLLHFRTHEPHVEADMNLKPNRELEELMHQHDPNTVGRRCPERERRSSRHADGRCCHGLHSLDAVSQA